MKKQILSEEFRRMQKLAGLITENELNEAVEAKAWLVDEENGLPKILRFATVEDAKDEQFDEMADNPYNRPLFTSLEDLKSYLDAQYMSDYDVEKYRFVKNLNENLNEANPTLDQNKLKSLILAIKQFGGSRSDKRDFSEIAKLLVNNELAKAAEMITLLDTSPNELFYEMMDETYPELWDMLFDAGEDDYIALSTPKADLNEWALDMNAARTHITPEDVERHGTYDPDTNTIEIEGGSDQMYEFMSDVYIAHEGEPENWWQNEKVIGPLRYRYEQAIEKAAKQKYGPDVTVEYY